MTDFVGRFRTTARTAALSVLLVATSAAAQDRPLRGWESGMDIYTASRGGEAAFYGGGVGGNNSLAFRFAALDEANAIPCSVGVMYEYVGFRQTTARIKPAAGFSLNRIFSCASDAEQGRYPSPSMHGSRYITAGVRIPMFKGSSVAGSLRVMGFTGRMFGRLPSADASTTGVLVGAVVHAP
jgi:hypothetical protein